MILSLKYPFKQRQQGKAFEIYDECVNLKRTPSKDGKNNGMFEVTGVFEGD